MKEEEGEKMKHSITFGFLPCSWENAQLQWACCSATRNICFYRRSYFEFAQLLKELLESSLTNSKSEMWCGSSSNVVQLRETVVLREQQGAEPEPYRM